MCLPMVLRALMFIFVHVPEMISVIKAIWDFFQKHQENPEMSAWMTEFAEVMTKCKEAKDPKALKDFLTKMQSSI